MGLEIERRTPPERKTTVGLHKITERLYTTAKGDVVEDGHPDAAFLFAIPGDEIPLAEAEAKGLVKQRSQPKDKQRKAAADK